MAFVALYGFQTSLTAATAAGAGLLEIDPSVAADLSAQLGPGGTSYASLSDGVNYEVVHITGVSLPNMVVVTRGADGTTSFAFPQGACLRFEWTAEGISAVASGTSLSIVGTGTATVSYNAGLNQYTVNVPITTMTATLPIEVLGAFPNFEIAFQGTAGGCCCGSSSGGGGGGGVTSVTATGLAVATGGPAVYNIAVSPPNFLGTNGVTVAGSWPNITIQGPGVIPPSGVASVTAGNAKIVIGGSPTNVTVAMAVNGALGAGTYNGVTFDQWGTITGVNSAYIPITALTSANANLVVTDLGGGNWQLTATSQVPPLATTAAPGIVQLALPTAAASNNAVDATSAVTPAGINAVLASIPHGVDITNSGFFTGATPASYTSLVGGTSLLLSLTATQTATIKATVMVTDTAVSPAVWGLGVFESATLLNGVVPYATGCISMEFQVPGPLSGVTISLKTTALAGTASVIGASLTILKQ